jgi:hypothetical protein
MEFREIVGGFIALVIGGLAGGVVGVILGWLAPLLAVKPNGLPTIRPSSTAGKLIVSQRMKLLRPLNRVNHAICNVYQAGTDPADCQPYDEGSQMMEREGATIWSAELGALASDQFAMVWIYSHVALTPKLIYKSISGPSAIFTP